MLTKLEDRQRDLVVWYFGAFQDISESQWNLDLRNLQTDSYERRDASRCNPAPEFLYLEC